MILYQIGDDTPIIPEKTLDDLYWSILPIEPLPELPAIKPGDLVVIEGRAPIWRYCIALHKLHGPPCLNEVGQI